MALNAEGPAAWAKPDRGGSVQVVDGQVRLRFDPAALEALGLGFIPPGLAEYDPSPHEIDLAIENASTIDLTWQDGVPAIHSGCVETRGALLLDRPGERVVIGNLRIRADGEGLFAIESTIGPAEVPVTPFELDSVLMQIARSGRRLDLSGELIISRDWAADLGRPEWGGAGVGAIDAWLALAPVGRAAVDATSSCEPAIGPDAGEGGAAAIGSDVLVAELMSVGRLGHEGNITAYAVGTTACNIGTARANWIQFTNQHPVIIQNMYRLKDGRFEQIGMSWVKHGFYAVSQSLCTPCYDHTDGASLGVGCSDPYSAQLNGFQTNMSPRATVNAHTGYFPYPWNGPLPVGSAERRLQVRDEDLNPVANPGAKYFVEGHYVHPDDCASGTQDNNASYRAVQVLETAPGVFNVTTIAGRGTQRGRPAVRAWHDEDSEVVENEIRVPGEGLFIVAAKVTAVSPTTWRYVYAVQNLNSDRSAEAFSVPIPPGASVANLGFAGVDHHSGEPFDTADWVGAVGSYDVSWLTNSYSANPNANALRFDTVFTFSFEADVPPGPTAVSLSLFKPGTPGSVSGPSVGPQLSIIDCNRNQISDSCDVSCAPTGCGPPCGESLDCDENRVPDECQTDCDGNAVVDLCDIRDCGSGELWCLDCNTNSVPDGCEADCDGDGIPDDCDPPGDLDGDGVPDCFDLCPITTPRNACVCPPMGRCCYLTGFCIDNYPREVCLSQGGIPECLAAPCRQGCLIGDCDADGDLDLRDLADFVDCYTGSVDGPDYIPPSHECAILFDFDGDEAIDMDDFADFLGLCRGP